MPSLPANSGSNHSITPEKWGGRLPNYGDTPTKGLLLPSVPRDGNCNRWFLLITSGPINVNRFIIYAFLYW